MKTTIKQLKLNIKNAKIQIEELDNLYRKDAEYKLLQKEIKEYEKLLEKLEDKVWKIMDKYDVKIGKEKDTLCTMIRQYKTEIENIRRVKDGLRYNDIRIKTNRRY